MGWTEDIVKGCVDVPLAGSGPLLVSKPEEQVRRWALVT